MERKIINKRYFYDGKPCFKLNDVQKEAIEAVKSKINEGKYKFESYACECGATDENFVILAEKDRYGFKMQTVICKKCGLMMTNPRMTQETYNLFYDNEYRKIYLGVESADDIGNEFFDLRKKRGKKIIDYVEKANISGIKSVLEIGCSAGTILESFKEKGYEIKGIDLGGEYIERGRKRGLDLEQCASSELLKRNEKYDLIILHHVFEHFLDLEGELDVIRKLLSETGVLYIAVPGILGIPKSYDSDYLTFLQNAHVYHFTLHSLQKVMARYGWEMIKGNEEIQSLFRFNTSVFVEDRDEYPYIIKQLKKMEINRPIIWFNLCLRNKLFEVKKKFGSKGK